MLRPISIASMIDGVVIGRRMALPPGETAKNIAPMRAREEVAFARYVPIDNYPQNLNMNAENCFVACIAWRLLNERLIGGLFFFENSSF